MITVHHLNDSRSERIVWLLEELKLPYEIKYYQRGKDLLAPPELKEVHPLGKAPVLTDKGETFAESGAIIEYLVKTYGPHLKPEHDHRYTYWMHFAEGSAMPFLLLSLIFQKIETSPMPFFVKPIAKEISKKVKSAFIIPNLKNNFAFIESELGKSSWFAGENFSAADIQMSYPVMAAAERAPSFVGPNIKNWIQKIEEREAFKIAQGKCK